ncbi:MAG: cellulose-binding protein CttA-related protein [Bacteroidales bacterium]|nr:cellulose-binding protein CttA-related protein [Bacteroidales bacterium]
MTFYYSDDDEALQPEDLIEKIVRHAVYSDGSLSEDGELLDDFGSVSFDVQTPKELYTQDGFEYSVTAIIRDEFGETVLENTVKLYIGEKGDANLDGTADAKDAAEILVYAAAIGAGQDAKLYQSDNESLEAFAFYLADVNGTQSTDATDAASILQYAAAAGSGKPVNWKEILGVA